MPLERKSLTLALAAAVLVLSATITTAQFAKLKNSTPEQRAKVLTDLMKGKLDLTPEQAGKVADINLEYAKKMQPIIQGSEGPFEEMREARQINEQKEAALKKVLTTDQFTSFTAYKEELREKFEERMAQKLEDSGTP